MFKRIASVIIVLVTLALAAGCGGAPTAASTATAQPAATAASSDSQATAPTATEAPTATAAPSPTAAPAPTAQPTATSEPTATAATKASFPVKVTDDAGRTVEIAQAPQRIVSCAPSNTEIAFALGLGERVVGVSDLDNYPPEVATKERVGGFQPNVEKIVSLDPDLVLAVGGNDDLLAKLEAAKIPVIVLAPETLEGIYKDIELVGSITGTADEATQVTEKMKSQVQEIVTKAETASKKPRVYWELDANLFTVSGGSFIDSLIKMAGGTNIFADVTTPFPQVSLEQIVARDPEVVILADAAYGESPDKVRQREGWGEIAAIKNNAVHPINDEIVSRPGPRVADGLLEVAKILHPELFSE